MNATEFLRFYRNPRLCGAEEIPVWEDILKEYPWFQAGWMLYLKSLDNAAAPLFEEMLHRGALYVRDRKELRRILEVTKGTPPEAVLPVNPFPEEEMALTRQGEMIENSGGGEAFLTPEQELIERFLTGEGGRPSVREELPAAEAVDLGLKAGEVPEDIITETFAELLVRQEKFKEAIAAFEKLSLRFPEKSVYFATRIEEVGKMMNY